MAVFFSRLSPKTAGIIGLLLVAGLGLFYATRPAPPERLTTTVDTGEVSELVSVSGVVKAEQTADLGFPVTGTLAHLAVAEGDRVGAGSVLASLSTSSLAAELAEADARVASARATYAELLAGQRPEERTLTDTTVATAITNRERISTEENKKVANARRLLLSTDLVAIPRDSTNDDIPPTISGTYTCDNEGEYIVRVFRSRADSGYSFTLSGLESGTETAYTSTAGPLGTCGLRIQFDDSEVYSAGEWVIAVPNTRGAEFASLQNAYALTRLQAENAITAATEAVTRAEQQAALETAPARPEAIARAAAAITEATARRDSILTALADRTLTAPFSGTITKITGSVGETVGQATIITMVADTAFSVTVRIPEIDIASVIPGQPAEIVFDAAPRERIAGVVSVISPLATIIDGVAYFEATITLAEKPTWLRGGLNADVDIIVTSLPAVTRLPKRFVVMDNGSASVLMQDGESVRSLPVEIGLVGTNGFIEVIGLTPGTVVVAP
jgi:multidrug efflux pump subunit AcrA (membrane-fusion protein)